MEPMAPIFLFPLAVSDLANSWICSVMSGIYKNLPENLGFFQNHLGTSKQVGFERRR